MSHLYHSSLVSVLWLCDLKRQADKVNKYDFLLSLCTLPASYSVKYIIYMILNNKSSVKSPELSLCPPLEPGCDGIYFAEWVL